MGHKDTSGSDARLLKKVAHLAFTNHLGLLYQF